MKLDIPKEDVLYDDGSVRCVCILINKRGQQVHPLLCRKIGGRLWEMTIDCRFCKRTMMIASDLMYVYVDDHRVEPYSSMEV